MGLYLKAEFGLSLWYIIKMEEERKARLLIDIFKTASDSDWLAKLDEAEIPCGPIQNFEQVFSMPVVGEREMLVKMEHPTIGKLPLVGSPLKMSETPVEFRLPPPLMGEHTEEVLRELGWGDEA